MLLLPALLSAAAAFTPAPASAGRYRALLCETPAGRNAAVEGLSFTTNLAVNTRRNTCGVAGGRIAIGTGNAARIADDFVRATLSSPVNLAIYAATIKQRVYVGSPPAGSTDQGATPSWRWYSQEYDGGEEKRIEECLVITGCLPLAWDSSYSSGYKFSTLKRALTWEVRCLGPAGSTCAATDSTQRVFGELIGLNIGLEDAKAPAGQIVGSELPSAMPRNVLLPVKITATDLGGGVLEAAATLDDAPAGISTQYGACADRGNVAGQPDYESLVPCPLNATFDLAVDPSVVKDGPHTLRILVRDAAGNSTLVAERAVVVGDPALGPPQAQIVLERGAGSYRSRATGKVVVRGKLLRLDGTPLGGQTVAVQQQIAVAGAGWEPAGSVTTAPDGSFAFEPVTTGSRTLRVSYGAATAQTSLIVRARMQIEAVRSVVRRPGALSLRGRAVVEPLPKSGGFVEIQLRDGAQWRVIGTRRTDQKGAWSFRSPLRGTGRATYRLRAKLRKLPTVPSEPSTSRAVTVRVR
jgi:hypothetical protein